MCRFKQFFRFVIVITRPYSVIHEPTTFVTTDEFDRTYIITVFVDLNDKM